MIKTFFFFLLSLFIFIEYCRLNLIDIKILNIYYKLSIKFKFNQK